MRGAGRQAGGGGGQRRSCRRLRRPAARPAVHSAPPCGLFAQGGAQPHPPAHPRAGGDGAQLEHGDAGALLQRAAGGQLPRPGQLRPLALEGAGHVAELRSVRLVGRRLPEVAQLREAPACRARHRRQAASAGGWRALTAGCPAGDSLVGRPRGCQGRQQQQREQRPPRHEGCRWESPRGQAWRRGGEAALIPAWGGPGRPNKAQVARAPGQGCVQRWAALRSPEACTRLGSP